MTNQGQAAAAQRSSNAEHQPRNSNHVIRLSPASLCLVRARLRAARASTGASEPCALERLDSIGAGTTWKERLLSCKRANPQPREEHSEKKIIWKKNLEASFLYQHISDEQCSPPLSTVPSLVFALQGGGRQGEISRMVSLSPFFLSFSFWLLFSAKCLFTLGE